VTNAKARTGESMAENPLEPQHFAYWVRSDYAPIAGSLFGRVIVLLLYAEPNLGVRD